MEGQEVSQETERMVMPFIYCSCGVPLSEISLVKILRKELELLFEQVTSQT